MPGSDLDRQLDALRERFRGRLPERLEAIETAWRSFGNGADAAAADELMRLSHQLAGTSGSYGLAEVAQAARDLEHAVRAGGPADRTGIGHALELLRHACRTAQAGGRPAG